MTTELAVIEDDEATCLCAYAGHYLANEYPGYQWGVNWQDGIVIRLGQLADFGQYCWFIAPIDIEGDRSLKRQLRMGAGELLERSRLPRDQVWKGGPVQVLEGADPTHRVPVGNGEGYGLES